MTDYYPIDGEFESLDFLFKRWKANGVFSHLSDYEILELIKFHEFVGHISIYAWLADVIESLNLNKFAGGILDSPKIKKELQQAGVIDPKDLNTEISKAIDKHMDKFMPVQNNEMIFISISKFKKVIHDDDFENLTEPSFFHISGVIRGFLPENKIKASTIDLLLAEKFESLLCYYVFFSKADIKVLESGGFNPLSEQKKREVKLNRYMCNLNEAFPAELTQGQAWLLLNRYDPKLFPPSSKSAIKGFFDKTDLKFKLGRRSTKKDK